MTDPRPYSGVPRWVKAFATTVAVVVGLFVALHMAGHGFGDHGDMPTMHQGKAQP